MRIIPNLSGPVTQADFAWLVGRSEGRISQLCTDGTLPAGATGLEWLQALVNRLSAEAAGRHSDGPLDLAQERAALAREQRIAVELRNQTARGEYAPIELLSRVLADASAAVVGHLEHLPARVRRACPLLPARALDEIQAVVVAARNEWVRSTCELVAAKIDSIDDGDEPEPEAAP